MVNLPSRAREIQAQEGVPGMPLNPWGGPPTSGNSTPLRENIPESPTDGFPDFVQLPTPDTLNQPRRARAGTVPSRFSPGGVMPGHPGVLGLGAKSARVTPSQTPYNNSPSPGLEPIDGTSGNSGLLSRLRAGSLPQRSQFSPLPGAGSPFGPSIFSSWNPPSRERTATLASIASVPSNEPSSPSQSQFSKEGGNESNVHMRTLDYLGLAETPQPPRVQLATPYMANMDFSRQNSRMRSYSVNNKDVHADEYPEEDYDIDELNDHYAAAIENQLAATQLAIRHHNLAVQAFANQASTTRRRAQTAGVLDNPGAQVASFLNSSSNHSNPLNARDLRLQDEHKFDDLSRSVAGMTLGRSNSRNAGLLGVDEQSPEGPTSALWLGNIPTSTTTSTLVEMFKSHGPILSVRVLTHKNCGFVNFERVDSAISAKANMNGKEIFPGASPIRINFAKPVSPSNTPGHEGAYPSPSPDPFAKGQEASSQAFVSANAGDELSAKVVSSGPPSIPILQDITTDITDIVKQFGASEQEHARIARSVQSALHYGSLVDEIPPIREPSHARTHDAPRLRDIRKRIDNQSLSHDEIEAAAMEMLPEIAELASDYLGNTVVQKLFEHCSEQVRDAMLAQIAPHLAEIGIHKNGTWAAQKIIGVCRTPSQMSIISESLRPYTIPLFLDQYGNYVLQCCLDFGVPYNDFIFETMLTSLPQLGQGRFGARAMRACLESHQATKDQQRMLAALIAIHSAHLATNQNGALLLTWYLDTCTFPMRRTVLAPRITPFLVHLCTHKVAYLTVLKVVNQKHEPEAKDIVLKELFFSSNDQVLEAILLDVHCGVTLIFKVLTMPFFDEGLRGQVVENVRNVLIKIKATSQPYKRLNDEVGLSSTRSSGPSRDSSAQPDHRRPSSRQANINGQQGGNRQFFNPLNAGAAQQSYDMAPYGAQAEAPNAGAFGHFNQGMVYNAPSNGSVPPGMNMQPQMQFQQNMLGRGGPQVGYNLPMQAGYGAYGGAGGPSVDQFRHGNMVNGSPAQPQGNNFSPAPGGQTGFAPPPGFNVNMAPPYGYSPMGGPQANYGQQDQGNSRRGRVSR